MKGVGEGRLRKGERDREGGAEGDRSEGREVEKPGKRAMRRERP